MLKQILSKIKNKLILFCTALAALLLYLSPNLSADESVPLGEKNQLTVMTFNLRFANENDPYPWSIRKEAVREFLKERQPDIFGTQEGIYSQLQDIIGKESAYDWIGTGRDGGSNGEFMAIFYKRPFPYLQPRIIPDTGRDKPWMPVPAISDSRLHYIGRLCPVLREGVTLRHPVYPYLYQIAFLKIWRQPDLYRRKHPLMAQDIPSSSLWQKSACR